MRLKSFLNNSRIIILSVTVLGFLISCNRNSNTEIEQSKFSIQKKYVSIDGLWFCTPETALEFPNGVLEPVIQISGDAFGKLNVRGCFLWDNRFYDYWELKSIEFIDSLNQLWIVAKNGSTFRGTLDHDKKVIKGMVYSSDPDNSFPDVKLDFIRSEKLNANKLFIPHPADQNGNIIYTSKYMTKIYNI
jgi:hypothetical protein